MTRNPHKKQGAILWGRGQYLFKLSLFSQVFYKAIKIAIPRDDNSALIIFKVNHGLQDQLGITVSFYISVAIPDNRLKHQHKTDRLKKVIELLIIRKKPHKHVCFPHTIL